MCCGKGFTHLVAPIEALQTIILPGTQGALESQGLCLLVPFAGATPPTALSLRWAQLPSTLKVSVTVAAHVVGAGEYGGGFSES